VKKILLSVLLLFGLLVPSSVVRAQDTAPASGIATEEGGPVVITGNVNYVSDEITIVGQEPVPALIDVSATIKRDYAQFAPVAGQIIGYLTSPLVPAPPTFEISLPIAPQADFVDVDNNGESDAGVQLFAAILAANINGGSYLEQLDQVSDLASVLRDVGTGEITEGSLLVFAPDDQQGFPTGAGEDGLFFTADDPTSQLPQGYTIARLASDGTITLDRAREGRMDVLQRADAAWPDFSSMGIVESYNALIDTLAREYAFTELRNLDWEAIRATYLPLVEEAEAKQDLAAYDVALRTMAQFIQDAHVMTNGPGLSSFEQPLAANLGANGVELSDGRIVVGAVTPGSALEEAGIVVGSEIVSIDGQSVEERLPGVIYSDSTGTAEGKRLRQVRNLLRFPAGAEVELAYRLPESQEILTATLTAGSYTLNNPLETKHGIEEISYDVLDSVFGYVTWKDFTDPIPTVDTFKDFLRLLNERMLVPALIEAPGLILDMRSNGGGWDAQY
jgi:hypothetical protein